MMFLNCVSNKKARGQLWVVGHDGFYVFNILLWYYLVLRYGSE